MDQRTVTPYGDTGKPYRERNRSRGGGRGGKHRGQWGPRGDRGGGNNNPPPGFEGRIERGRGRSLRPPTRTLGNQTKSRSRLTSRLIKKRDDSSPLRASLANKIPHGFIFGCTNSTEGECLERNLFGLPANNLAEVKKVCPGTALFLFNYEERVLTGVFAAASQGAENVISNAWGGQFPAQVRVVPPPFKRQIPESQFKPILHDNYFGHHKFIYHLREDQVTNLCKLFDQSVPQVGQTRPPRYVLPYNRATVMKRTVARPNSGGKLFGGLRGVTITPDSVKAPPSKRGQNNFIFGGGGAQSLANSGQNSGTAMDTSDYSSAPHMEATSNPTGFGWTPSSPARFDPYVNNTQVSESTPVGQGLPSNTHFGNQPAALFNGGQNNLGDSNPFGGDNSPGNMQGAWGSDEKMKTPVRFGSNDFPPPPAGASPMEFQSGGDGAGPSHVPAPSQTQEATTPTRQPPAADSTGFGQHHVGFGGGSPTTPPKKRKGKFDWGRLTSSSGAPIVNPMVQRNAEQPPSFGAGGAEPATPSRDNTTLDTGAVRDPRVQQIGQEIGQDAVAPPSPTGTTRDPRLQFQGQHFSQKSMAPPQPGGGGVGAADVPPSVGQMGGFAASTGGSLFGQRQQHSGNVGFGAQSQQHQEEGGFSGQVQQSQGNVAFGAQSKLPEKVGFGQESVGFGSQPQQDHKNVGFGGDLQQSQGNVGFGSQPQQSQVHVGFGGQSQQQHQGKVEFGSQSQQLEGNVSGGERWQESRESVEFGKQAQDQVTDAVMEKDGSSMLPPPVLFSSLPEKEKMEQKDQQDGNDKSAGKDDDVVPEKENPVKSGAKRKAESSPIYFETDKPYKYIKGMPIITADHIMARGIGNHNSLFTERGVGGFICVPGMDIPKKKDLPPKIVKEEEIKLSERSQHFIKVATGFYSGGETKEEQYKNMLHGRLSIFWRSSCGKAWKIMKALREHSISTNRLHLFNEVVEESGYIRDHGIIPVKDGKCPLF